MLPIFRTAGMALAACCCAPQLAQAANPAALTVELRADATLDSSRARLSDIARVASSSAILQDQAGSIEVGAAPMVGQPLRLSRAEVEALVRRRLGRQDYRLTLGGAAAVRVTRAARLLQAEQLASAATDALAKRLRPLGGRLELATAGTLAPVEVPVGNISIAARAGEAGTLGARMPVWVDIAVDGQLYRSVVVGVVVKLYRSVYVARHALAAGAELNLSDLDTVQMDVAGMPGTLSTESALAPRARMLLAAGSGAVLLNKHVAAAPMVMRGDQVTLVAHSGGLTIETAATALDNAMVGRDVRVQGTHGSAPVMARVISPQHVQLQHN
jgi:flagella basal body P-ring formation protein FlgA